MLKSFAGIDQYPSGQRLEAGGGVTTGATGASLLAVSGAAGPSLVSPGDIAGGVSGPPLFAPSRIRMTAYPMPARQPTMTTANTIAITVPMRRMNQLPVGATGGAGGTAALGVAPGVEGRGGGVAAVPLPNVPEQVAPVSPAVDAAAAGSIPEGVEVLIVGLLVTSSSVVSSTTEGS